MKTHLFFFFSNYVYGCSAAVDIIPELKWNILNFGYGANFKYEGMLSHSFDRFYVVTKFELPKIEDLHLTIIQFDSTCSYLDTGKGKRNYLTAHIPNLSIYCQNIVAFMNFIRNK